jgi:phenylpyruvate tautomerase PptA (4-oxalocrotonate tautomerase family)
MPFVRIDVLRADQAKLDALGRAVQEALIDAIGIPPDDLFQVLTSHDGVTGAFRYDRDYLGVHRDDGLVFVDITMRSGRTSERKQALYRRIAELASKYADTEPRNIFATIHENDLPDWSFGDGIAQYATGPAPHDAPRHAPAESSRQGRIPQPTPNDRAGSRTG